MKNFFTVIAVAMGIALGMHFASTVSAQAPGIPLQIGVSGSHTACAIVASTTELCGAADGLWISINGATYTQVGAPAVTGVTSFNGRTGAVTSASGDYSYSQLSSQPTSLSCPQASLSTTGLTSGSSGSFTGTCSLK